MSIKNWPGGRISPTPPTPSGPYENSTASGVWTLDQVAYWEQQNQWPTAGNVNPSAFIENLFQTWLYTGNGSTQTITNGIDLSGNGGMVWLKGRSQAYTGTIYDTNRGATKYLQTPLDSQSFTLATTLTSFNSNGFSIGSLAAVNASLETFVSWAFRKQAKFFDVVTWTGDGVGDKTISHSLGSTPGFIIAKRTDSTGDWWCYHRSLGNNSYLYLNANFSVSSNPSVNWNPTSNSFVADSFLSLNVNGATYVAYLFAHDAGGFGLTGTDNVISCGSFTTDGSGLATVNLGYEPQWVLLKDTAGNGGWFLLDTMRGLSLTNNSDAILYANTSAAEILRNVLSPTATGFVADASSELYYNTTYIYIAIRRGPMKTPTTGTSVFSPNAYSTTGAAGNAQTTGFPVDWMIQGNRSGGSVWPAGFSRLQSGSQYLQTSSNAAEATQSGGAINFASNTNFSFVAQWFNNGAPSVSWSFQRAPGFFDVVCYTGNGSSPRAISHNLAVAPELIISKSRSTGAGWIVYAAPAGFSVGGVLNSATAFSSGVASVTATSASTYTTWENDSGVNFVAYLFASCPGVSKVGSYTGTGALQTVNCGFTGGARFVLIKRTDSTGDWWVYDSARGITSGNDPYLLMNSTAAEVTGTNYVDTTSVGFQVTAAAPAGLNASGGTYIFLAIA